MVKSINALSEDRGGEEVSEDQGETLSVIWKGEGEVWQNESVHPPSSPRGNAGVWASFCI